VEIEGNGVLGTEGGEGENEAENEEGLEVMVGLERAAMSRLREMEM